MCYRCFTSQLRSPSSMHIAHAQIARAEHNIVCSQPTLQHTRRYGFDKENDFTAEPTNVVFYDLGASSYKVRQALWRCGGSECGVQPLPPPCRLQVSIVSFSATVGKKNKTQGGLQVWPGRRRVTRH